MTETEGTIVIVSGRPRSSRQADGRLAMGPEGVKYLKLTTSSSAAD